MVHIPLSRFISLILLMVLLGAAEVQAQHAVVRGFAKDASDGQPLQGVNVVLTNDAGAFMGTATDRDGFFALSRSDSTTISSRPASPKVMEKL